MQNQRQPQVISVEQRLRWMKAGHDLYEILTDEYMTTSDQADVFNALDDRLTDMMRSIERNAYESFAARKMFENLLNGYLNAREGYPRPTLKNTLLNPQVDQDEWAAYIFACDCGGGTFSDMLPVHSEQMPACTNCGESSSVYIVSGPIPVRKGPQPEPPVDDGQPPF